MAKSGTTTGNLKLRSGPGMQFEPPLAFLEPNTALEVLGEEGDWLHVRVGGKEGYVGRKYVALAAEPAGLKKSEAAPETGKAEKPAGGMAKREAPPAPAAGTDKGARKSKPFVGRDEE